MVEIIGVRFRTAGRIYYFDPGGKTVERGTGVIVETVRGMEYGMCELANRMVEPADSFMPLRKIIRIATPEDGITLENNRRRMKEAFGICLEKIDKHGLEMKLVEVELTFDATKIIFYFTADGRVDFRELVKDLAGVFRMRIELRQIGVRDESKFLNGIGICGRTLCCATFLEDFQPVSIKMAKDQSLSLNPTKISGICGRLMCCLKYEEETYERLNEGMPTVGDVVKTPDGEGDVLSISVLRRTVRAAIRKNAHEPPNINTYSMDAGNVKILRRGEKSDDKPYEHSGRNRRGRGNS